MFPPIFLSLVLFLFFDLVSHDFTEKSHVFSDQRNDYSVRRCQCQPHYTLADVDVASK